jgi:hypothetical protein
MVFNLFSKKEKSDASSSDSNSSDSNSDSVGKYNETCSLCGKAPTDKKWGGQYFHKKCFRKLKKGAKGMI